MTKAQLLGAYPLAAITIERLCAADPNYGSQKHQRDFIQRLHAWQGLAPCSVEHEEKRDASGAIVQHAGEHREGCYPRDVVVQAAKQLAEVG